MDEQLRRDFPIDWDEDQYVSRREFFKFMTLASGGLALGSAGLAAWSKAPRGELKFDEALIASTKDVPVGGSLQFSYPRPSDLCVLIQTKPGKYVAYSRRCTHLSCPLEVQTDQERLYCPCHNGAFSLEDGHVLQGPPPRPLPQIIIEIRGDQVFAKGVKQA
jgi:Rieske Fe-S protein